LVLGRDAVRVTHRRTTVRWRGRRRYARSGPHEGAEPPKRTREGATAARGVFAEGPETPLARHRRCETPAGRACAGSAVGHIGLAARVASPGGAVRRDLCFARPRDVDTPS